MSLRFSPAITLPTNSRIDEIAVADVNEDSRLDLVIATGGVSGASLTILLGNGTGQFVERPSMPLPNTSSIIATGDWNGDGLSDVAITSFSSSNPLSQGEVSILLGDGTGQFNSAINTSINVSNRPNNTSTADFNRDGQLDLALDNGRILLGNGAGGFGKVSNFPTFYSDETIAVGDFNGDGIADIGGIAPNCRPNAYRCYYTRKGTVLLGDGTGQFSTPQDSTFASERDYAVADFNGDGNVDLAGVSGSRLSVRLGSGKGTFSSAIDFPLSNSSQSNFNQVAVGDFNQDGLPDLVAAQSGSQSLFLLLNSRTDTEQFLVKAKQLDFSAETRGSVSVDLVTNEFVIRAVQLIMGQVPAKPDAIGTLQNDLIRGNNQRNLLQGYAGNDRLMGLDGNDQLIGGDGKDQLIGGKGKDTFLFTRQFNYPVGVVGRFSRTIGVDRILDFDPKQDRIVLDRETFLRISKRVSFDEVDSLADAQRSWSYIVYIQKTGRFYYNENLATVGFGKGGLFADLRDGLELSANTKSG